MSHYYGPPPSKPDSRIFASYPMPAKIDLIKECPRRESLVEQQLENKIGQPLISVTEVTTTTTTTSTNQATEDSLAGQLPSQTQWSDNQSVMVASPSAQQIGPANGYSQRETIQQRETVHQIEPISKQNQPIDFSSPSQMIVPDASSIPTSVTSNFTMANHNAAVRARNAALLAAELAEKEAKLMVEINSLHQRPYSPFQTPNKIDLMSEHKVASQQLQHAPSPRSNSRASSNRSTSAADFLDKEAKLLQEIEEIERKPYNPQTMVVEREQWYEYPENRPYDRRDMESKRRVKDFCSLPSQMYPTEGKHLHEENPLLSGRPQSRSPASNMQATIIRSPKKEIDNKSPLPFAFDNFTTKGVRGNIATVGAVEPDRPRAPIYPIMKRTPSPNMARG